MWGTKHQGAFFFATCRRKVKNRAVMRFGCVGECHDLLKSWLLMAELEGALRCLSAFYRGLWRSACLFLALSRCRDFFRFCFKVERAFWCVHVGSGVHCWLQRLLILDVDVPVGNFFVTLCRSFATGR